jgi:UDP-4-amino-4,6-dideoxy-N-acetyl-beta-L-altrosamine transaminase
LIAYIPYTRHYIDENDIAAVVDILRSELLTTGPKAEEFEKAISHVVGSKYAVVCSSGTAALHIAAMTAGFSAGDEVIVSPLTFAASANCILYQGATPVFADIDSETMLIDPEEIKRRITPKTKAIIPVHYGGELCDMGKIETIALENGLTIIQDAAHAIGGKIITKADNKIDEKSLGSYSGMQIWSFHPAKTITSGEGGAVTTNDEAIYKKLLRLRTHGITRDASQYTHPNDEPWYYEMNELSYNYRITDFQCALGISQLKKLPHFAKRRAEIVQRYNEAFRDLPLEVQKSPTWSDPVRHLYTIRLHDKKNRRKIFDELIEKNISVNVHYIPVYWLPYYERLGYKKGLCPNAEDSYERLITLPLYASMSDEQVEYVIEAVRIIVSK